MFWNIGAPEIILLLFVFVPSVLWIISLVDILRSNFPGNNKLVWVFVVLFFPLIGAILYFIIGHAQKTRIN